MRGMSWRTVVFLIVLGAIVFTIRGSGTGPGRWWAAFVMASVVVLLVVAQLVGAWTGARRRRRPRNGDSN